MTHRYTTKAWQDEDGAGWGSRPTETVFEDACDPVNIGILDQYGTPLFRVAERGRLGFDLTPPRARVRVKARSIRA